MSATCPACGVAVVPGYVKCPKCGAPLPSTRAATAAAGGTAIAGASGGPPVLAFVVGGVVALGIVLFFALRKGDSADEPVTQPETAVSPEAQPTVAPEIDPDTALAPAGGSAAPAKDPTSAMNVLDRALKTERLWGTLDLRGDRIDVRSASCGDAAMKTLIDANAPALREGGLTRLRCLEQSGGVVFERDL